MDAIKWRESAGLDAPEFAVTPDTPLPVDGGSTLAAEYNATPPTYNDGDPSTLQTDASGNLKQVLIDPATNAPVQYPAAGWVFDVAVAPTVTAGAYSAGDIMGALLTFLSVAPAADAGFIVTGAQVSFKSAIMPNPLTLILFSADPTNTTKTDNAAYSLHADDAFKVLATIPFQTLGVTHFDHGTPNTIRIDNLFIPMKPVSGTDDIYGLLIDGSGVTPTGTADVQVRLRGIGG